MEYCEYEVQSVQTKPWFIHFQLDIHYFVFSHLSQGFSKSDHHRSDSAPNVELKPLPKGINFFSELVKKKIPTINSMNIIDGAEPDDADRKKKTSKSKAKGSMPKPGSDSKPNISYPTVSFSINNRRDNKQCKLSTYDHFSDLP